MSPGFSRTRSRRRSWGIGPRNWSVSTSSTGRIRCWRAPGSRSPAAAGTPKARSAGRVSLSTSSWARGWTRSRTGPARRIRVFEVDHPATQHWKRRALATARIPVPEGVTFVAADLTSDSLAGRLAAAGFDAASPALVSWLGVTMYLTPGAIAQTMAAVGGFAPGSELIADYMLPEEMRDEAGAVYGTLVAQAAAERGEPWLSFFAPEEMTDLGREAGFARVHNVRQRDTVPGELWARADSLRPADLAMLFHGVIR